MRKMLVLLTVVAAGALAALASPTSALACDTSYWNVHLGCEYYAYNDSHSAYPGVTPNYIYVRLSADPILWFYGKTKQFVSTAGGSWVTSSYAQYADDKAIIYVGFSNSRGGCLNASVVNGTIFINCATHLN